MSLKQKGDVDTPFVDYQVPLSPSSESHNVALVDGEVQGPYKKRSASPTSPAARTRDSNPDTGGAIGTPGLFSDAPIKRAG